MSPDKFALPPDEANSVYREVARSLQFRRTGQTMGALLADLDVLRRKAESKMQMWGICPRASSSKLRKQNGQIICVICPGASASLSRSEKSPVLAKVQVNPGSPSATKQMRRISRPRGGAAVETSWLLRKMRRPRKKSPMLKAKKKGGGKRKDGDVRKKGNKTKGNGRTSNGLNRRT